MTSMTTTPGFIGEEINGRWTRVLRIIRWWKPPGMAQWRTVHGSANVCLPKPSGKKRRGEPMVEDILGETNRRIGVGRILARGWNDLRPVGGLAKGASPYGILDLAGNGWEWVSSAYLPYPYNPNDGREDLTRLQVRVTRGGSHDSSPDELTTTQRGRQVSRNPRGGHHNIGFRCAR